VANQNRVTAGRPPGALGPAAASFSAGNRLPAPEAITRIERAEREPGVRRQL
jgi:hypothetical protein